MIFTIDDADRILSDNRNIFQNISDIAPPKLRFYKMISGLIGRYGTWQDVCEEAWNEVTGPFIASLESSDQWDVFAVRMEKQVWFQEWHDTWREIVNRFMWHSPERRQAQAQLHILVCMSICKIFKMDYAHHAFELTRFGVIVIESWPEYHIFGKNGENLISLPADFKIKNNHLPAKG